MDQVVDALSGFLSTIDPNRSDTHREYLLKSLQSIYTASNPPQGAIQCLIENLGSAARSMPVTRLETPVSDSSTHFTDTLDQRMSHMRNVDTILDQLLKEQHQTGSDSRSLDIVASAEAALRPTPIPSESYRPSEIPEEPGYTLRDMLDGEFSHMGDTIIDDELMGASPADVPDKTLWYDFNGNVMEVDRVTTCVESVTSRGRELEIMMLPVIHESFKTGFEPSKKFDYSMDTVVGGRYKIVGFLGSAAFSTAVRAVDIQSQRTVCLKIIQNNKDFFDQSLDEIKVLRYISKCGDLDKVHCLKIYDYLYFKEHLIIVTELLRDNLYDFSRYNGSIPNQDPYFTIGTLQKIAHQILTGVGFIHSVGLIHCDLKPENILFKSYVDCNVKIIDFGSSCFDTDRISTYVQSRCYRAPEVLLGCQPYNNKIDIWSVGCILTEIWTGGVLFQSSCMQTLIARIQGIIGKFPEHMMREGQNVADIFIDRKQQHVYLRGDTDPDYDGLPNVNRNVEILVPRKTSLFQHLRTNDTNFLDFMSKLLQLDPELRISAHEALQHPFITSSRYSDGIC